MAESDCGDASDRYEYDAPCQVVDLKELANTESDDKWFGKLSFNTISPDAASNN